MDAYKELKLDKQRSILDSTSTGAYPEGYTGNVAVPLRGYTDATKNNFSFMLIKILLKLLVCLLCYQCTYGQLGEELYDLNFKRCNAPASPWVLSPFIAGIGGCQLQQDTSLINKNIQSNSVL